MSPKNIDEISYEDLERIVEEMTSLSSSASFSKKKGQKQVHFEVLKTYIVLGETKKNKTVFAKIRWGMFVRYDLRKWDLKMTTPYKGITFSKEELRAFLKINKPSSQPGRSLSYKVGSITAKIHETLLNLSTSIVQGVAWNKQVNIVDWGYGKVFDIRKWTDKYDRCSKGICLNAKDFSQFYNVVLLVINEE